VLCIIAVYVNCLGEKSDGGCWCLLPRSTQVNRLDFAQFLWGKDKYKCLLWNSTSLQLWIIYLKTLQTYTFYVTKTNV